ncbi:rhomboid family intramembrane serine protease [Anditalea andensis]|uniref:Protease n=1 Tax=Anditalea andensis TaxID=1048983 RepID=A0A074KV84_9BACT|nr:rhomboid family intramembrane serine protease [Anditalea andensis]KEO72839.1 protease [Anditalea andensis]
MDISITIILIALTCVTSFLAFRNPQMMGRWMFTPYHIRTENQLDRFILSGFIHKDGTHLLFNMFTFYFFGNMVEEFLEYYMGQITGGLVYVLFYLIAIIISDIPTYIKQKNNPHYHALGASGGVSATVFASIMLVPLSNICIFGILCLPGFILGILFLIYSVVKGMQDKDGINHDAHLYGALFGILFIFILTPQSAVSFYEQIIHYRPF